MIDAPRPHRLGLVLSGGGILGIAHIGMLKALEEVGLLDEIEVAVGTSAGSIMGAMFALGYSPDGMWEVWQRDAWKLFGGKVDPGAVQDWNVRGALDALVHWDGARFRGLLHGDKLLRAFTAYLVPDPQGVRVRPTRPACPLFVIAANYTTSRQTVWRFVRHMPAPRALVEAAPGLEPALGRLPNWSVHDEDDPLIVRFPTIAEAVRCSISIPFVFVPAQAPTQYAAGPLDDSLYVDGGVHDNYSLNTAVKLAGCDRVIGMSLTAADPFVAQPWDGLIGLALRTLDQMGHTIFEADQDDGVLRATDIRTLIPRLPVTSGTFDVAAMPALYAAGLAVTREFLQRVGETAGSVTWDTIFATRVLNPWSGGGGDLRPATPRAALPPAPPPWPDLAAPDLRYFLYEKVPEGV